MSGSRSLSRREVLVLLGGASVVITTAACGGGGGGSSPTAPSNPPAAGDKVGAISGNHGHTAVITSGELQAGGALTLNIQGSATHNHSVALSGDQVVGIRNGTRVSRESSNDDGHTHTVTFN